MTNRIELKWDLDYAVDEQRYYCSETPIDPLNLPSPKAVLAGDVRTYVDTEIEIGKTYYVRVGSVRNGVEKLSDQITVTTENYVVDMRVVNGAWVNTGVVPITMSWVGSPTYDGDVMVLNDTQYLSVPSNEVFNLGTGNFEFSFEINSSLLSIYRILVSGISYSSGYVNIGTNYNNIYFQDTSGSFGSNLVASNAMVVDTWYTVKLKRTSSTLIEFIINDVVVASKSIPSGTIINFNPNNAGTRFFNCTWDPNMTRFIGKVRRISLKR